MPVRAVYFSENFGGSTEPPTPRVKLPPWDEIFWDPNRILTHVRLVVSVAFLGFIDFLQNCKLYEIIVWMSSLSPFPLSK